MTKQEARTLFKAQRQALTLQQQHRLVAQMLGHFEGLCKHQPHCLLSFMPMAELHEVPVFFFEEVLTDRWPALQVAYPRVDFVTGGMQAVVQSHSMHRQTASLGLAQPLGGQAVPADAIDLIFVPLLAIDAKGNRVGYGKGFYDRYLATCRPGTVTVGFSFFEALPQILNIDPWDVPLKYCVTPQQLYEF
jgi:5-formyltetrahydrofolate cyclo-ligase